MSSVVSSSLLSDQQVTAGFSSIMMKIHCLKCFFVARWSYVCFEKIYISV